MVNRGTWLGYLIVAALALGFSSNFLFMFGSDGTDIASVSVRVVFNVLAMLLPAFFAYYQKTSLKQLFFVLLALAALDFALGWLPVNPLPYATDAISGAVKGLSITMTGSVLFLLPQNKMRPNIILGFALSVLFIPAIHLVANVPNELVKTILFALYLATLLLVILRTDPAHSNFPSVSEVMTRNDSAYTVRSAMFAQQTSATLMVIIATLLSAILGMFVSYSFINGYVLASSDTTLLVVFLIVLIMYLVSLAKPSRTWFNTLFSLLMLACIAGLFAALMVPGFPPVLSSYFNIMLVVAMIPVCVFAIGFAKEHGISPVFICGTLPLLINTMFNAGYLLNLVLHNSLGTNLYDISKLAATSLACIAGIVIILFVLVSRKLGNKKDVEGASDQPRSHTENTHFAERDDRRVLANLMDEKGLSSREAEIALMFSQGRSAPYISQHLYLAESTVKSHLKRIYTKLGIHNKQELLDLIDAIRVQS